jgi:hypothetical protein
MLHRGVSVSAMNALILGIVLLLRPVGAIAQHHGGGQGAGSLSGGIGRPDGVDEKDSLRDFHQALLLQATSQQIAEFQALVKSTEAAQGALQAFQQLPKESGATVSNSRDALDKALETARNANKRFQEGFSPEQKSGLKEVVKRLTKSDSDLEQEAKKLDQSVDAKAATPEVTARAEGLDKALTDFYDQELALGKEMSITLASGQDLTFMLPQVKSPATIGDRKVAVNVSGALSLTASQGGQRTFKLDLIADLTDLQQNITEVLRSQFETGQTCGERVAIRQASLAPSTPTSLLVVKLHFERWTCMGSFGQQSATELAEGDGGVEIKMTAGIEKNAVKMTAALGRIDATGMLAEALRSGSLGEDLRDKTAQVVLTAAQAGSDFKIALPPAVQNSAVIESARFQDTGVGGLSVVLEGQVEISNAQADQLAVQLNQALAAQGASNPATPELKPRPGTSPQ